VEGKGYKNIINLPDLPDKPKKKRNPEYRHNMASFLLNVQPCYGYELTRSSREYPGDNEIAGRTFPGKGESSFVGTR
jgi:hypothetical protein